MESPFSDYYSDHAAYSPDPFTSGSAAQRTLLHRLSDLGSQIVRASPNDQKVALLQSKLDAIESILSAPDSQSRKPAEIDDSGLFVDDDVSEDGLGIETEVENVAPILRHQGYQSEEEGITNTTNDIALQEVEEVLARIIKVNADLHQRYVEVKVGEIYSTCRAPTNGAKQDSNQSMEFLLEEANNTILSMSTENDQFRNDLSYNHSEILFLKLQLKALEVQASPVLDQSQDKSLLEGIERWKQDWKDVDKRFTGRRHAHKDTHVKSAGRGHSPEGFTEVRSERGDNGRMQRVMTRKILSISRPLPHSRKRSFKVRTASNLQGELSPNASIAGSRDEKEGAKQLQSRRSLSGSSAIIEGDVSHGVQDKTPWQELCDSFVEWCGVRDPEDYAWQD